jgi:hypothetical protein
MTDDTTTTKHKSTIEGLAFDALDGDLVNATDPVSAPGIVVALLVQIIRELRSLKKAVKKGTRW